MASTSMSRELRGRYNSGSDSLTEKSQDKDVETNCLQCMDAKTKNSSSLADSVDGRRQKCWKCTRDETPECQQRTQKVDKEKAEESPTELDPDIHGRQTDVRKQRAFSTRETSDTSTDITMESRRRFSDQVKLKRCESFKVRQNKPLSLKKVSDIDGISDFCDSHVGKVMEYYCKEHNDVLCSVCMSLNHTECINKKSVEYIPNFVNKADVENDLKDTIKNISEMTKLCREHKEATTRKISEVIVMFSKITEEIKYFRKRINEQIDELEHTIAEETRVLKDKSTEHHLKVCDQFDTTMRELKTLNFELLKNQQSQNVAQSFVIVKKTEKALKKQKRDSGLYEEEETIDQYFFEPDIKLETLLESVTAFGSLKKRQKLKSIEIKRGGVRNVRSKDDKKEPWITGLVVLSESRVLVTDYDNHMVKLIDTELDRVKSALRIPSRPHDVTRLPTNPCVITLPDRQKLLFLSVYDDELCVERSVAVNGKCFGIDTFPDGKHLVVTLHEPARVQIIKIDGTLICEFSKTDQEGALFSCPEYVSVSNAGHRIYVTDYDRDSLTVLNINGKVQNVFNGVKEEAKVLEAPKAVFASEDGFVYVCGSDSNNILMFTNDCTQYKEILTSKDGLQHPVCFGEIRQAGKTAVYVNGGQGTMRIFTY